MSSLSELFDQYSLRARLYPGLLAVLPVTSLIVIVWDASLGEKIAPILVTAGAPFLLAQIVRARGKKLEISLVETWGGLPTTIMLRDSASGNRVLRERRRTQLGSVVGEPLPSRADEIADPAAADSRYETHVRVLISRVRDKPDLYPRVHEENINYGFRRNLLGLRRVSLMLIGLSLVADVVAFIARVDVVQVLVALAVQLALATAWIFVVNSDWVKDAGESYAERLFDALETLQTEKQS